ncbi:MAG: TSUP family transporter [Cellvibrio sp.]|uniref:TSUP family transporter n=1 Tax=Cellvibrio sp. TaxID=1965322 RepID=UPI0031B079C1
MADLQFYQYVLIALIFVWSGFVRSGLGFGGAVMSLPLLLLIDNQPLVYLPIIAVHLLFFSSITVWQNYQKNKKSLTTSDITTSTIDWDYLKKSMKIMIIPKLIGVAGILTLPASLMTAIIFAIVSVYSISYIFDKPFKSSNPLLDKFFLVLGAYISGTSLIGAPLIMAVFSHHVSKLQLRDTLFVLWFILVVIKMVAFVIAGVDLQLEAHLWLLPAATLGHLIGLRFHQKLLSSDPKIFYRVIGFSLLGVSLMGIASLLL